MSKLKADICQHGGVNDASWTTGKCPLARTWAHMHERCNPRNVGSFPAYAGCSVHPDWLHFTKFYAWAVEQNWQGNVLDKDLKIPGNKTYSADACLWVPQDINKLLVRPKYSALPVGVHWDRARNLFVARLRKHNVPVYLGRYATAEEASRVYNTAKAAHIRQLAVKHPSLSSWLEQHAALVEQGLHYKDYT